MTQRRGIEATEAEWGEAQAMAERLAGVYALAGTALAVGLSMVAAFVATVVVSGGDRYLVVGGLMALFAAPVATAMSFSSVKQQQRSHEFAKVLQRQLAEAVSNAEGEADRREVQVRRQEFEARLANALEMAEGEPEVIEAVERAFVSTLPESPVELLLADNSHAHLSRMAASSPTGDPPTCGVDSPDHCPAARRAQVQRFSDSEELDACPKLRGRALGRCSAVCVPVSIMGRTVGVIHATAEPFAVFGEEKIGDLQTLANLAGARIGLLRVMAETQLQAATDSLTGLLNRRALENKVRLLRNDVTPFAIVMADLDHFKQLNDTYGHETGDRALRLFAQTLRGSLRGQDLVCRYGGEEFAIVLPSCTAVDAGASLESVRANLDTAVRDAGLPKYTASFGVVDANEDEDFPTLLGRADAAMFEAKLKGRNRVVVHNAHGTAVTPEPRTAVAQNGNRSPKMNGGRRRRSTAPSTLPAAGND
ncbi:MAG: sensor domain-containing diguanylate cyclase [Acidimicrobiia bacterium]